MRRTTHTVHIGNIPIGSQHAIVVQSMTNTLTANITETVQQIKELADAGSEIVRITVNDIAAAKAVPSIVQQLRSNGYTTPIVGDFHYNGHVLLTQFPDCANALDKLRINPGNAGKKDIHFKAFIDVAVKYNKPVRIGVNAGSLDQELLQRLMDENATQANPTTAKEVWFTAMIKSAIQSAALAEEYGLPQENIIISAKVSDVQDVIKVNQMIASRCAYPLHIGLTEAGMGQKGIVASTSALSILLQEGIGDTIRVSITPEPGQARTDEVKVCQLILQSLDIRKFRPTITSCPGCGRTSSNKFQQLAKKAEEFIQRKTSEWREQGYRGFEAMTIAVMGCIVNGPGESKHANIGISFPGNNEHPRLVVYEDGKQTAIIDGDMTTIEQKFLQMVEHYVQRRY